MGFDDPATVPIVRRRWLPRPRFSLRTLLLFTLLVGCVGTLWQNWGPWGLALRLEAPSIIENVWFSSDDRFVVIEYMEQDPATKKYSTCFDVRIAETGARHGLLRTDSSGYSDLVGDYIWVDYHLSQVSDGRRHVFNLKTLQELPLAELCKQSVDPRDVSANYVLYSLSEDHYQVRHLPDCKIVEQSFPKDADVSLDNSDHLYVGLEKSVEIRDLNTGRVVRTPEFKRRYRTRLHGTVIVNTELNGSAEDNGETVCIFDAATGAQLLNAPGHWFNASQDGRTFAICGNHADERLFRLPSQEGALTGTLYSVISPDGELIADERLVRDTHTLLLLWSHGEARPDVSFSPDSRVMSVHEQHRTWLADSRTGKCLLEFASGNAAGVTPEHPVLKFGNHSPCFTLHTRIMHCEPGGETLNERIATVWQLRRPLKWYGLVWLPEFWMAVVTGVGLGWSVWRDRREYRRR